MKAFGAELVEHGEDFQSPRGGRTSRQARRSGIRAFVPSRLVTGSRPTRSNSCARRRPRRALCADRAGIGHLRLHPGRDLLGLATEIVGVQSTAAPSYALSFAAGTVVKPTAAIHWPTAWRRVSPMPMRWPSFSRALRASCRSATMKWPRRSAPTGPIRITSRRVPARPARRSPAGQTEDPRQASRPDPERRQYRFRSVQPMGRCCKPFPAGSKALVG